MYDYLANKDYYYYTEKPCMFQFIQLLKTHITKEIQLLARFIKIIFIVHKQSLFD